MEAYVKKKVAKWSEQVELLAGVAKTEPHAAYAGFIFGLRHRFTFTQRTIPGLSEYMDPAESKIRNDFLPALFQRDFSDLERDLLALPAREGGMSIDNPVKSSDQKYHDSLESTAALTALIVKSEAKIPIGCKLDKQAKAKVEARNAALHKEAAKEIEAKMEPAQQRAMQCARLK